MSHKALKVLFIGSFPKVVKGGISQANKLLIESEEFQALDIIKIDSTIRSLKKNFWVERVLRAIMRFVKLNWFLLTRRPKVALIFCGHGFGFLEKGFYLIYLRFFGVHSVLAPRSGIILKNLKTSFFKWYVKGVFKRASWIICQGKYWKRIFANYAKPDKLVVLHNWLKLPEKTVDFSKEEGNSLVKFLYLGWFEEYKGISTIMMAAKDLKDSGEKFELHLYGEGSMRKDLQNFIADNNLSDTVFLHNWITGNKKEEVFLSSSALLIPSKFEGMPNVLLEAMSYGLPVISNGITTVPEIIKHKESGLLYFRQSIKDLKTLMRGLIHDPALRRKLSRNARQSVEDNHQISFAADKIIQLLENA